MDPAKPSPQLVKSVLSKKLQEEVASWMLPSVIKRVRCPYYPDFFLYPDLTRTVQIILFTCLTFDLLRP